MRPPPESSPSPAPQLSSTSFVPVRQVRGFRPIIPSQDLAVATSLPTHSAQATSLRTYDSMNHSIDTLLASPQARDGRALRADEAPWNPHAHGHDFTETFASITALWDRCVLFADNSNDETQMLFPVVLRVQLGDCSCCCEGP